MKSIKIENLNWVEYRNEKGYLHREDGPAIEWNNGTKEWWINGNTHREDGPAIEYYNGHKKWRLNGKDYSKENWEQEVTNIKLKRILDL
jgi:hypothetical protein